MNRKQLMDWFLMVHPRWSVVKALWKVTGSKPSSLELGMAIMPSISGKLCKTVGGTEFMNLTHVFAGVYLHTLRVRFVPYPKEETKHDIHPPTTRGANFRPWKSTLNCKKNLPQPPKKCLYDNYPLVNQHHYGKSSLFMGKLLFNGNFPWLCWNTRRYLKSFTDLSWQIRIQFLLLSQLRRYALTPQKAFGCAAWAPVAGKKPGKPSALTSSRSWSSYRMELLGVFMEVKCMPSDVYI